MPPLPNQVHQGLQLILRINLDTTEKLANNISFSFRHLYFVDGLFLFSCHNKIGLLCFYFIKDYK